MEDRHPFDLAERTAKFGEAVIELVLPIDRNDVTGPLIRQVVRAAGSVGANYAEADDSQTPKEKKYRMGLARRESKESRHWLRLLARATPDQREAIRLIWREADELNRIFSSIIRKLPDE